MAEVEKPIFTQRIGVIYGGSFMSWPFGRIDVYSGRFVVSGARFSLDNVDAIVRQRRLISTVLSIIHRNPNAPRSVDVASLNRTRLENALREAGFDVVDKNDIGT